MSYQRNLEKRIKVAVIGVGSHCYRNILPSLTWLPVELVAVCDVDLSAVSYTAKQYGCSAYTSAEKMYQREPEIQAVFISVGAAWHPQLILEALDHGKHVWVEKPIALRATQVKEMMERCNDLVVVAGLKKAFTPAAEKAREMMATLGCVRSILAVYPMSMPQEGELVLEDGSMPNWLRNGVHPLSFLVGVGGRVKMVQSVLNEEGFGVVIMAFESGAMGTLHLASGPQPDVERYSIFADNWQMDIEDANVSLRRGITNFNYRQTKSYISPGDTGGTIVWKPNSCVATLENKAEFVQGFYQEMQYFCDCILQNKKPELGNLSMALEIMEIYEGALRSNGRPVYIHEREEEA